MKLPSPSFSIAILCWLLGIFGVIFFPKQADFSIIWLSYTFAFAGYFILLSQYSHKKILWIWSIIGAAILIPIVPNLSDDYFRFLWDGRLIVEGVNPYAFLPSQLSWAQEYWTDLYPYLNSPSYYSIYPSINQLFFTISTIFTDSLYGQILVLKLLYFSTFIAGLWALQKIQKNTTSSAQFNPYYYILNPLVIAEGLGNLHAEVLMVSFLFLFAYAIMNNAIKKGALWYAMAINTKLTPILLGGFFLLRLKDKKNIATFGYIVLFTVLIMVPVIIGAISGGFLDSIDLYFRKFEYNGSAYILLRWLGIQISGYNLIKFIGPLMFIGFTVWAFRYWWNKRKEMFTPSNFANQSVTIWTIYLLCSTIVHPWYIIGLIGLGVWSCRIYVIVWSYMITFTYINYSYTPYSENLMVVALEYTIVALVWYIFDHRKLRISSLYK